VTEDKPAVTRSQGKGWAPRPLSISEAEWSKRWSQIFKSSKKKAKTRKEQKCPRS
jgi:uncharacterized protein YfaQ (DUF2300 family)